jgi:mannose-6-phosphate isomerase-like protein (cupin superfamily)
MQIEFRARGEGLDPDRPADRVEELTQGELIVVPQGEEHRTLAENEAEVLIFEPAAVLNTGNVVHESFTAPNGVKL